MPRAFAPALSQLRSLKDASRLPVALAPWLATGFVLLWAAWAIALNSAQFGDNIEQFNWAHSLERGYYKHPPLPTWLLGAVIHAFGPSRWWAIALSTLCMVATAWLTWSIARRLLGETLAAAAVILWSLQLYFSMRVQLYNHNTVLVLCVAAMVWCALRARGGSLGWWLATGLCAGCALLSKYSALLPIAGVGVALALAGHLRSRQQRRGALLAVATAVLVCLPHAVWVVQHHFVTFRYAAGAVHPATLLQRLGTLVSFSANQLRMLFPALAAISLTLLVARFATPRRPEGETATASSEVDAWFLGLLWLPLAVLFVMAMAGSVALRNHWGVQCLQFVSLWMALRWHQRSHIDLRCLILVAAAVQGGSLALYASQQLDPAAIVSPRRMDTLYPAQRLADAGLVEWQAATPCPLRYVAGSDFEAGLVSLYSGASPAVFENEVATPWIAVADLRRHGALYVVADPADLPPGTVSRKTLLLAPDQPLRAKRAPTITLAVLPPEVACTSSTGDERGE